ncbi:putative DnaJ domain, Chaperone J-domain superfamily [Helianthus anomalus]
MTVLLHLDKNKAFGADEAFKRVSEAWSVLSDSSKRNCYDVRINSQFVAMVSQFVNLDTFWTVCMSWRVQYEYLRNYVNKRLWWGFCCG